MEDGDEDGSDDDEMDLNEQGPPVNGTPNSSSSFLPPLVAPLLELILPTPFSFPPITGQSQHPPTTSALSSIHICALECLNNIFLSLAAPARSQHPSPSAAAIGTDVDSGLKVWNELWKMLSAVGTELGGPGQEPRRELWQLGVGVLWGVAEVWKGSLVNVYSFFSLTFPLKTLASRRWLSDLTII